MAEHSKLGIKDLAEGDRPREKLLQKGLSALSDAELIAILLGSGSAKESAVELARKIMAGYGNNLNELGKASIEHLKNNFYGVGEAKAITIVAAMELGRRRSLHDFPVLPVIKSSSEIYKLLHPVIGDLRHEEFWIILLNRASKVKSQFNISKGGMSETIIDIRLILRKALENEASSIIMCHNHPSGNTNPSDEDIKITRKLKEAGSLMDIAVLDHVIITESEYFSFADNDMI